MAGTDVVVRFIADAGPALSAARDVESQYERTANGMVSAGKKLSLGLTLPLAAVGVAAFKSASDLSESLNKSNVVFEQNGRAIEKWAAGASDDFGQSQKQALDAASSFGNMFRQLDVGIGPTTKMSKSMVELASDFASFHNVDVTSVLEAQTAAFRGEYDALQKFVPTINAAAVETKALAMTGKENASELTAQEKALATYELMLSGAGKALGDYDRTADGAANTQRRLAAEWENTKAQLGATLVPVVQRAMDALSGLLDAFKGLPAGVQEGIVAFGLFAAALGPVMTVGGNLMRASTGIINAFASIGGAAETAGLKALYAVDGLKAMAPTIGVLGGVGVAAAILTVGIVALGSAIQGVDHFEVAAKKAKQAGEEWAASQIAQASALGSTDAALDSLVAKHEIVSAKLHEMKEAQDAVNLRMGGGRERYLEIGAVIDGLQAKKSALGGAIKQLRNDQDAAAESERQRKIALDNLAIGTTNLTTTTDTARQAVQQLTNAYFSAQGGVLGYESAQLQVQAAEARLTELQASGTASALEIAQATNAVEQAKLGAARAAATLSMTEADLSAVVDSQGVPGLIAMRDSLVRAEAAHHDATGATQAQIDKINAMIYVTGLVQPEKTTKFNADTIQAQADIIAINAQADATERMRTILFEAALLPLRAAGIGEYGGGGVVPGPIGAPQLAIVHGGESITPHGGSAPTAASSSGTSIFNITVHAGGLGADAPEIQRAVVEAIRGYVGRNGRLVGIT